MPKIRAAVLHGINDLRVQEWLLPDEVEKGCVRVKIAALGICQSDVHYWCRGRIANFILRDPMVIGHECAGIVTSTGPGVTHLSVGDAVALEPGVPCWSAAESRQGRYNLDPNIKFFATPPYHGSLATYVDHPADWCYKLPQGVSLEEGAMCEPLSVGVHACRRAGVAPGKKVAIMGAGPIGLVTLLAAQAFGADVVAITDLQQKNLDLAAEICPGVLTHVVPSGEEPENTAMALKNAAREATRDDTLGGFEIVIDCAGFEPTVRTALAVAGPGGRVVMVGLGQEEVTLPLAEAAVREIELVGSFRYAHTYPICLSLLANGKVNVKPLITHRFDFDERGVADGFAAARDTQTSGAVKVMFTFD